MHLDSRNTSTIIDLILFFKKMFLTIRSVEVPFLGLLSLVYFCLAFLDLYMEIADLVLALKI